MGSGAARKRASRQKARPAAPTTTQAATWRSAKTNAPSFAPDPRARLLQGWQSFPNQDQSFTLNQEARNTNRSAWNESDRLRDNAIRFVSGGNLSQDKVEEDGKNEDVRTENVDFPIDKEDHVPSAGPLERTRQEPPQVENEALGTSNTKMEVSITTQVEQLNVSTIQRKPSFTRRRSTSASSTSSSEVILFAGRGNSQRKREQSSTPPTPQTDTPTFLRPVGVDNSYSPKPLLADTPSLLKPDAAEFVPIQTTGSAARDPLMSQGLLATGAGTKKQRSPANHADQQNSKGRPRRGCHTSLENYDDEEEEIIRDYIENMKESRDSEDEASANEYEHQRNYNGSGPEIAKAEAVLSTAQAKVHSIDPDNEWNSDDLRDFDELETSDDEPVDIGGVFSRRERQSGLQYLVTPVGQSTDFAKWILKEKLTSVKVKELILAFEETHPEAQSGSEDDEDEADVDDWEDSASGNSEERALNDLIRDHESEHEENERILDQTSQMTDAELARILNKQAELGLDTDDVVLFDGAFEQSEDFIPFSTKKHTSNRTRAKRNRRTKDTFPSAEAFADVLDEDPYNGFDVMDFERPSLKPKKKGRKSANGLPFELEDGELADQLAKSWANDRSKKAAKKAEREELRQAGLLGAKAGKGRIDVQTKYKNNGMDMDQVKAEIRAFLLDNDREAMALASMASPQRAQVHLLAKALYLESHSQGKGNDRFPILTKTAFSGRYDEHNISQIDALLAKRKFSSYWGKRDKAAPRAAGGRARRSGGGGGGGVAAGATYMDGDVVGAAAPALGSENRGRAMLEKMGWSSGMGIGKVGNKGSVEVIKHVVKNSKAGLG
jgi:R3H domain/G-patch domain